jgi:ribosome-binding factor A
MAMSNLRQERVRELLRRAIGEAIRREFHVSDVGLITVNDIDVGGDLKSAVVFITILGNPTQQKHGLQVLEQNRIRLQSLVANSVVLKYTPTLKFIVDDSIVRGNRVLQILDELEKKSASSDTGVSPVRSDGNET